jgi:hypothetical protein
MYELTPCEAAYGKSLSVWGEIATTLQASGLDVDGKRERAKFNSSIKGWRARVAEEGKLSEVDLEYGEKEFFCKIL